MNNITAAAAAQLPNVTNNDKSYASYSETHVNAYYMSRKQSIISLNGIQETLHRMTEMLQLAI